MAIEKNISSSISVVAVEDALSYQLQFSAINVVHDTKTDTLTPNSIVVSAISIDPGNAVTNFNGTWYVEHGATAVFMGSNTPSITISETRMRRWLDDFPLRVKVYDASDLTHPIATGSISKIVEGGTDAAILNCNPPVQFYDADSSGAATAYGQYEINFVVMVGNTAVTPSVNPTVTFEGSDTQGVSVVAAGYTGFNISVAAGSTPNCKIKIVTSVQKDSVSYTVTGYVPLAAIKMGPDGGSISALSKMYYYDGVYNASKQYSLTTTQAPYVLYGDQFYVLDNAANGGAAINARNLRPDLNAGGDPWTLMNSEMKYYIAEAMFANFAKLGSAIFNQDFQLSQYGALVGYGGFETPVENTNYYQYADADNMLGTIDSALAETTDAITVSNPEYDEEFYVFRVYLYASKRYYISIRTNAVENQGIGVRLAPSLDYWDSYYLETITDSLVHNAAPVSVQYDGYCKLYYKKTGSQNKNIEYAMISEMAFRPNTFIDFKKGFLYSNKGYFQDVTVEGKVNNLITVIDWDNNIGRDKIIEAWYNNNGDFGGYTESSSYPNKRYYIDILNCGDYMHIKSLPTAGTGSTYTYYRLPFFGVHNVPELEDRGHTRDMDGNPHLMSAEDMYKLVGKKVTIRTSTQSYYNCITGLLALDTLFTANTNDVANGRHYYYYQQTNIGNYPKSIHMIPQVVHIECQSIVWSTTQSFVNYWGYGYVWVGCDGIGTNTSHEDEIAEYWK